MINKREIGSRYEQKAVSYLKENGMIILQTNYYTAVGEVDIIGKHEGYLVFVEVKYRSSTKLGFPEEAVNDAKQKKICRVADWYKREMKLQQEAVRYDVICILEEEITWYQNAFEHHYRRK